MIAIVRPKGNMCDMVRAYDPFQSFLSTRSHWTVHKDGVPANNVIVAMSRYLDRI